MGKFLDNTGLTKLVELIKGSLPGKATSSTLGLVKPDNSTITVDSDGVISSSGGGSSYTFTNGLTESSGTVSWDLNEIVQAGTGTNAVKITGPTTGSKVLEASGNYSMAQGGKSKAQGQYSHAEGYSTTASGQYSHAEGNGGRATGDASHTEGSGGYATQANCHAEGMGCHAEGWSCHAEGGWCYSLGYASHAEGQDTYVYSPASHSEGKGTCAGFNGAIQQTKATACHAEGYQTIAESDYQHVEGKFNVVDRNSVFQHIVGNGVDSDNKNNAQALDWSGNQYLTGNLYVGCSDYTTTSSRLTTANCGGQQVFYGSLVSTETSPTVDGAINWVYG